MGTHPTLSKSGGVDWDSCLLHLDDAKAGPRDDEKSAERVGAFLNRQIEGDWRYLWIDGTYVKTREAGRIVSVAVIVAVGVNTDGQREVLGLKVGASEAEPFWTEFLRSLNRRYMQLEGLQTLSDTVPTRLSAVAR